jgi:hypothetical protein
MAKKKTPPKEIIVERSSFFDDLSPQAKQAIWAVLVAIVGVFFLAAIFDMSGPLGHYTFIALDSLFGAGAYLSPLACAFFVYILLNPKDDNHISRSKVFGIILFFLAVLGLLEHTSDGLGGYAGLALLWPLSSLLGGVLAGVILFGLALISIFLFFNTGLHLPKKKEFDYDDDSDIENLDIPLDEEEPADRKGGKHAEDEDEATADADEPAKRPLVAATKDALGLGGKSGDFVVGTFRKRS